MYLDETIYHFFSGIIADSVAKSLLVAKLVDELYIRERKDKTELQHLDACIIKISSVMTF